MVSPPDCDLVGRSAIDPSRTGSQRVPTLPRGMVVGLAHNAYGCMGTLGLLVYDGKSTTRFTAGSERRNSDLSPDLTAQLRLFA